MFNKKSLVLGAASALLASGLVGCGGGEAAADLTYWCPQTDNKVMNALVEAFKADNPEYKDKNIKNGGNFGEDKAYAELHKSLKKAADVILMVDDNIREAVNAEELVDLSADKSKFVTEAGEEAVASVSVDDKMYGYPYRADNSPLPIYDKAVFSDATKLNSLEGMLEACKAAGKKFYLDIGNGWYNAFLIWAGGAQFTVAKDSKGKDVIRNNVVEKAEEVGEVLKSVKALFNQYGKDTWVVDSNAGNIEAGFKDGKIGCAFLWNDTAAIKAGTTAQIGVAGWPTLRVGTNDVKLKCFRSYKAVVVKDQAEGERLTLAKAFAKYLAEKSSQEKRLELEYGPANLEVQKSDGAKNLEFAGKILAMANENRVIGQATNVAGAFWDVMGTFGSAITNGIADGKAKAWGSQTNAADFAAACVSATGWTNYKF